MKHYKSKKPKNAPRNPFVQEMFSGEISTSTKAHKDKTRYNKKDKSYKSYKDVL